MATKKKNRDAAAPLGREGGRSKSPAKVAAAHKNSIRGKAKGGRRPKEIIQDGVVFVDEGGGTYLPEEKKP